MRDITKILTVINTGKKGSEAGAASQPSGVVYMGAGGGGDLNDYLLKSIWDKVWEIRADSQGTEYIYGKLPVVLQYGLTMYSGDGVDIPSIYEGLPIDNDTIYWKDGILKAKAGTEGAITEITSSMVTSALGYTPYDASNPNGYITSAALANYALSSDVAAVSSKLNDFLEGSDTDNIINKWKELETFLSGLSQSDNLATILGNKAEKTDLAKYIPIAGATDITGEKNFIGGLKVNGSPIYYDTEKKYWKLEGDLLVTGGVTMYGNDSDFVPSTIMDAILYDDSTLGINAQGQLYVKGGTGGGISSVTSQMIVDALGYTPASATALSGYLPLSGGTLTGNLTVAQILNTSGNVLISQSSGNSTYVGNASVKTILFAASGLKADISGTRYDIWHSGNDGSGSGLDADLLDGKHYSDIVNGNVASATRIQAYTHDNGAKVIISGSRSDSTFPRKIYDNGVGLVISQTESSGTVHNGYIASVNSNVASATKLQTARTIWGQSFDGTGNVNGILTLNYNSSTSGIELTREGNNECSIAFNNGYGRSVIGSWGGGTHLWIQGLGNIITANMTNGNVGIGTTSPREKLEVSNYALIGGNIIVGVGAIGFNRNTYQGGRYDTKYQGWQIDIGGNTLNFYTEGSLGSGNKVKFDASGNILATGGVTMYSDSRKKTILNHVVLSLQQVANAPLIEHYYNSDQNKTTHVGSIAQYWAEMNDWFCKKDSEGFYTMEIQNAALASAISVARELVKFETETDRRIRLLEEENKGLKEEVEQLKWNIA